MGVNILVACRSVLDSAELSGAVEGPGVTILPATNGEAAKSTFGELGPRIILVDWQMEDMSAEQLYDSLGATAAIPTTQWVVVANEAEVDAVLKSQIGTDVDILVAPLSVRRIASKIRSSARAIRLAVDLQLAQQRIRELEGRDPLTGAFSRATLIDRLRLELERSWRDQRHLGVLLADVDDFKSIKEKYGEAAGDGLIQDLCDKISKTVRPYDLVGRLGDSAFLFILPGCAGDAAGVLAERIRAGTAAKQWNSHGQTISCTLSLGVTSVIGVNSTRVDQVLGLADDGLRRSKNGGGNRVTTVTIPAHLTTKQPRE